MAEGRSLRRFCAPAFVLLALSSLGVSCSPQANYPTRAIEYVVAYAAGGGTDVAARIMAKYLSTEVGVPVNIANKAGGNQIPAVMGVLSSTPDGYTLLNEGAGTSSMHMLVKDLPYTMTERTFGPMIVSAPTAYVVNGKSPWNSLKDVVEAAKKDPSSITWVSLGGLSNSDFAILQLLDVGGVDISKTKPVAFEGSGPGQTAVAGGHVKLAAGGTASLFPLVASGDLKVLAWTGDKRVPALPTVPSAAESGFPNLSISAWMGVSGPKGLPKNVLDRIDGAYKKVTGDAAFAKELEAIAYIPTYRSPEQMQAHVTAYGELVKSLAPRFQPPK